MHTEFLYFVKNGVRALKISDELESLARVSYCPKKHDSLLTTDVACNLAHQEIVRSVLAHDVTPLDIARSIVDGMKETCHELSDYFVLNIAGFGHINAKPSRVFAERFFEGVLRHGVKVLFEPRSFVSGSNVVLSDAVSTIALDWSDLIARGCGNVSSDVSEFSEVLEGKEDISLGDRVMLLALLADMELETEPYRLGLKGRQNVPWYFRKFNTDSKELLKKLGAGDFKCEDVKLPELGGDCWSFTEPCLWKILGFRHEFLSARQRHEPWHLVGELMSMVRGYYLFYNHPKFRALVLDGFALEEKVYLAGLVRVLRDIVRYSLESLELFSDGQRAKWG